MTAPSAHRFWRSLRHWTGRRRAVRSLALRGSQESGYALLMALFLILLMTIGAEVAMQNLVTQGRRQHEEETIWRGRQYVRAVRLYYHKTGHYPQTLDDLQKGMPELHFLRLAAYKDPMNAPDGEWRMIYVNAAGQIIGSVRYATLQQMALMDLNGGQLPANVSAALPGVPASSLASGASTSTQGASSGSTDNAAGAAQNAASGQSSAPGQAANPLAQLKPTGPVDGPVLGAFLTGVGSKVNKSSVKVYHGGKKYNEWEFIWNPLEDQARAVQQGLSPQGPQPGQPGQPIGPGGIGANPSMGPAGSGAPATPQPVPPQTPPQ